MCNSMRFYTGRMWLRVGLMVGLIVTIIASIVYAQEPASTTGLILATSPSLLDKWLQPQVITSAVVLIVWFADMRSDVKQLKVKVQQLEDKIEHLDDRFISRELVDALLKVRGHEK